MSPFYTEGDRKGRWKKGAARDFTYEFSVLDSFDGQGLAVESEH
jgi:hypothetical protein